MVGPEFDRCSRCFPGGAPEEDTLRVVVGVAEPAACVFDVLDASVDGHHLRGSGAGDDQTLDRLPRPHDGVVMSVTLEQVSVLDESNPMRIRGSVENVRSYGPLSRVTKTMNSGTAKTPDSALAAASPTLLSAIAQKNPIAPMKNGIIPMMVGPSSPKLAAKGRVPVTTKTETKVIRGIQTLLT